MTLKQTLLLPIYNKYCEILKKISEKYDKDYDELHETYLKDLANYF